MYLAAPVDSLVPLGITENSGFHKARSFASLPLNLNELSWKAIAQARRETAESMTKLAESRATNFGGDVEAFAESLRIHIKNLANSLEPTKSVSKTPYVLTLGGAACGLTPLVGAAIGNVEATSVAMLTALASAAGTMAFSLKSNQYRDSDVQRRRGSLITTLHRAATGKST